jgi:aldehyde:ferredoxin oxidoreductase
LKSTSERIAPLERLYFAELGLGREDDRLPSIYFKPPKSRPHEAEHTDRNQSDRMLTAYYAYHGWD